MKHIESLDSVLEKNMIEGLKKNKYCVYVPIIYGGFNDFPFYPCKTISEGEKIMKDLAGVGKLMKVIESAVALKNNGWA